MPCLERSRGDAPPRKPGRRTLPCMLTPARAARFRALTEAAVAATLGVPLAEVRSPTRGRAGAAFARQVTMYLAHVVLGMNYGAIGHMMGRDRTTVQHACLLVEQRRDDPGFDRMTQLLESMCAELVVGLLALPGARP